MSVDLHDFKEMDKLSNCCSSWMYSFGDDYICGDCKEHCEAVDPE